VLRASGLGDLLTAVPAIRGLGRAFPDHRLTLATPRALVPVARLIGPIDAVIPHTGLARLTTEVVPDVAVNLHGCGPQSHHVLLGTGPRRLFAFANPMVEQTARGPQWCDEEHDVERWCRMLAGFGVRADPDDLDLPPPAASPAGRAPVTIVHPGAGSAARRWPGSRWAEVVRHLASAGRRVVITGAGAEAPRAAAIARLSGVHPRVLAGATTVEGLVALVAHAERVVSPDTGVAHLATAFGVPSVVLFGPVPPSEWGPPPERTRHVALWAGRRGDPAGTVVDPGLLAISVGDVTGALDGLDRAMAASRA
jgi:ADP-heptose:LPS heptosyltransferase